ncbi:MAG: tetratricopeptide repeat protein [Pseudomonadota bacterium]
MKSNLGLSMIVKNEEECLARCLNSVESIVDEIVIVDTGSEDRTVEIARSYGAKTVNFPWNDDFGEARNVSLRHATKDWILVLDADEVISEADLSPLKGLTENGNAYGYKLIQRSYSNKPNIVRWQPNPRDYPEGQDYQGYFPSPLVRLFRNDPRVYFRGKIHETVEESLIDHGLTIVHTDIPIHHYGAVRGELYFQRKLQRYIRLERKNIEDNPRDWPSLSRLGSLYLEQGETGKARGVFEKVMEMAPDIPEVYRGLALVCEEEGKTEEAVNVYSRAVEVNPRNAPLRYNYGKLLEKIGKLHQAVIQYKEAIRFDRDHFNSHYQLGVIYYDRGLLEEAAFHFAEVIRGYPHHAVAHHNLGAIYENSGRLEDAILEFKKAIHYQPAYETAHLSLGILLTKLNRFQEAQKELEETLKINPRNLSALKILAYIRESQG